MTEKEALEIIFKVTSAYKGTRQEHALLQEAERVLLALVEKKKKKS